MDQAPVDSVSNGLEQSGSLSGGDAGHDLTQLLSALRRQNVGEWVAKDLLGAVSDEAFGTFIPTKDGSVEPAADDGIVGGLDDGSEESAQFVRAEASAAFALDEGGDHGALANRLKGRAVVREICVSHNPAPVVRRIPEN